MNRRGFTLLEVLVATMVMAIAAVGLLSSISTSLTRGARVGERDRAALFARHTMDELLVQEPLPRYTVLEGPWDPAISGGLSGGWRAQAKPFEAPPNAWQGVPILERIELEVWWMNGEVRRSFALEGFRRALMTQGDVDRQ